jgi:hypothetical protein
MQRRDYKIFFVFIFVEFIMEGTGENYLKLTVLLYFNEKK